MNYHLAFHIFLLELYHEYEFKNKTTKKKNDIIPIKDTFDKIQKKIIDI